MRKFKPSVEDCRILRLCAERDVGKGVIMRPGYRYAMNPLNHEPVKDDLNICHYTNEAFPKWDETDLSDNSTTFADFRNGKNATLTDDGNGIFDFYLYKRVGRPDDFDEELMSNITAYYQNSKLAWVEATGFDKPLWMDGEFTDARSTVGSFQ